MLPNISLSSDVLIKHTIPGLRFFNHFLPPQQAHSFQLQAVDFHANISKTVQNNCFNKHEHVSKEHNLKSRECYRLVQLEDGKCKKICGQHFEKYGEAGHQLTYFIGNTNIPEFVRSLLIPSVSQIAEIKELAKGNPLEWNMTFNSYRRINDISRSLSGFGFHKDIAFNGDITMIYSIGSQTIFQIRHPSKPEQIVSEPLCSHSLTFLSKEARWDFEHRVPPEMITEEILYKNSLESIGRISVVLGCKRKPI